jgi:hypothetical protein
MKKLLLLALFGAALIGSTYAQSLGDSAEQVERTFGKSLYTENHNVDTRLYICNQYVVGVVYDSAHTAQAYYYFKFNGGVGLTPEEAQLLDNATLRGAGQFNWTAAPIPPQNPQRPACTVNGAWFAINGNSLLMVSDVTYGIWPNAKVTCRLYSTDIGARLAAQMEDDAWSRSLLKGAQALSNAPKTRI